MMLGAKFGWNWPSGSGEKDKTVKVYNNNDNRQIWSVKLTWALDSGELKMLPEPWGSTDQLWISNPPPYPSINCSFRDFGEVRLTMSAQMKEAFSNAPEKKIC